MKTAFQTTMIAATVTCLAGIHSRSANAATLVFDTSLSSLNFIGDRLPYEFRTLGEFAGCTADGTAWFVMDTGDPDSPFAGYHGITKNNQHVYSLAVAYLGRTVDGFEIHMTPTQLIGILPDGRWLIIPPGIVDRDPLDGEAMMLLTY